MTWGDAMAVSPADEAVIFTTGVMFDQGLPTFAIDFTTDGGSNWNHVILDDGIWGRAVAFDPFNPSRVFVAGVTADSSPRFMVSDDLGQNWSQSQDGMVTAPVSIYPDPVNQGVIYCGAPDGVYKTTDGAQTWQVTALTAPTRAVLINPDDGRIYAGTKTGVYYSEDAGGNWQDYSVGLTAPRVLSLALARGTDPVLYAGTESGGVFRTPPMLGMQEVCRFSAARGMTASSPCRGFLSVRWDAVVFGPTARDRALSLGVFDACGRFVLRAELSGHQTQAVLDLRGLGAGTYLVRLTAPGWSVARPFVVAK
jgi:hypothetical protein